MSTDTSPEESSRQAAPRVVRGRGAASSGPRVANRWIALAVLSLAQLMVILGSTIVSIALPTAQHDLGSPPTICSGR